MGRLRILGLLLLCATAPSQVKVLAATDSVTKATATAVEQLATEGIRRLAPEFPGTPRRPIRFVLHANESSVPEPLRVAIHPGVPGFALLQRDEIHIVMAAVQIDPPNDLKTTVEHELVHILLDQHVGRNGFYVPRWFHEGLAQVLSGDGYLAVKEEDLVLRARGRSFIPFRELVRSFPRGNKDLLALAYSQSDSFVAFLRRELGLPALLAIARECSEELPFDIAFARRTRKGLSAHFEDRWLDYLLNESGAGFRVLNSSCFMFVCVAVVGPLLALAVARRRNREEHLKDRLVRQEEAERQEAEARAAEEAAARESAAAAESEVEWMDWDVDPSDPDYQIWRPNQGESWDDEEGWDVVEVEDTDDALDAELAAEEADASDADPGAENSGAEDSGEQDSGGPSEDKSP